MGWLVVSAPVPGAVVSSSLVPWEEEEEAIAARYGSDARDEHIWPSRGATSNAAWARS